MILSCPTCPSRYRFDEARLPETGAPVRCKNCRTVFRAMRPSRDSLMRMDSDGAPEHEHGVKAMSSPSAPSVKARSIPEEPEAAPRASSKAPKRAAHPAPAAGPVAVPVSVAPSEGSPQEADIRRLTRIIFSDIVIYGPDKADKAILQGRFVESYKTEIEEGRKIIRSRFASNTAAALETFQRCLDELLEARKKELASAIAL